MEDLSKFDILFDSDSDLPLVVLDDYRLDLGLGILTNEIAIINNNGLLLSAAMVRKYEIVTLVFLIVIIV
jgi:hypothetical protein